MELQLVDERRRMEILNVDDIILVPRRDNEYYFLGNIYTFPNGDKIKINSISKVIVKDLPVWKIDATRGSIYLGFKENEPNACVIEKEEDAYVIKCSKTIEMAEVV